MKISGRYLPIAPCTSLTDALYNHDIETPLLAAYIFASPRPAKYLSQHLQAHISLVNQIPPHLLLGPAAPTPDITYRYSREMFSRPRPQFVQPTTNEAFLKAEEVLKARGVSAAGLRHVLAIKPLGPARQPRNEMGGFFETGFFVGAGINVFVLLPLVGLGAWAFGKRGVEYALRSRGR